MLTTDQISLHLAELRDQVTTAETRRRHTALQLASAPKDAALRKALVAVDKTLAEINAEIRVFEDAHVAATEHEGAAHLAEEVAGLHASRDAAIAAARERVKLGAEIEAAIDQIQPLLEAWEAATETCVAQAVSVVRGCYDGRHCGDEMFLVSPLARGELGGAAHALIASLHSVARRSGMNIDQVLAAGSAFSGPVTVSMDEAAALDADKLRTRLDMAVARKEKSLGTEPGYNPAHIPTREELIAFSTPA